MFAGQSPWLDEGGWDQLVAGLVVGRLGIETIERILALQTPLQQITVGSGRRLRTQTWMQQFSIYDFVLRFTNLSNITITVAHPHILQVVVVEPDGGGGAGELKTCSCLPDRNQGEKIWWRGCRVFF